MNATEAHATIRTLADSYWKHRKIDTVQPCQRHRGGNATWYYLGSYCNNDDDEAYVVTPKGTYYIRFGRVACSLDNRSALVRHFVNAWRDTKGE